MKSQLQIIIILSKPIKSTANCPGVTQRRKMNLRSNQIHKGKRGFIIKDNINGRSIKFITINKASQ